MSDYAKTADIQALQAALGGGIPVSQLGQYGNGSGHGIYTTHVNAISIDGCIFTYDTGTPTAISLNNGGHGYVGPLVMNGSGGTRLATSSFTDLIDKSAG